MEEFSNSRLDLNSMDWTRKYVKTLGCEHRTKTVTKETFRERMRRESAWETRWPPRSPSPSVDRVSTIFNAFVCKCVNQDSTQSLAHVLFITSRRDSITIEPLIESIERIILERIAKRVYITRVVVTRLLTFPLERRKRSVSKQISRNPLLPCIVRTSMYILEYIELLFLLVCGNEITFFVCTNEKKMDPLGEEEEEMSCSKVNEKRRGEGGGRCPFISSVRGRCESKG